MLDPYREPDGLGPDPRGNEFGLAELAVRGRGRVDDQ